MTGRMAFYRHADGSNTYTVPTRAERTELVDEIAASVAGGLPVYFGRVLFTFPHVLVSVPDPEGRSLIVVATVYPDDVAHTILIDPSVPWFEDALGEPVVG